MKDTPERLVTLGEIATAFGLTHTKIDYWIRKGFIPESKYKIGRRKYPGDFVKLVMHLSKGDSPTIKQARLCYLVWKIETGTKSERRKTWPILNEMRKKEKAYLPADVAPIFGYNQQSVSSWARTGLIAAVKAGRRHFILPDEVERVAKILKGLTAYEVAETLGVSVTYVFHMYWDGRLQGALFSQKNLRFDPDEVARVKKLRDTRKEQMKGRISAVEVAKILRVHPDTLLGWEQAGVLTATRIGSRRLYEQEEVEHLKKVRSTINKEFEWLEFRVDGPCFSHKQVARHLGITTTTLITWIKKGVPLPYFNLTPPPVQEPERLFPQVYILQLIKFAGGAPVRINQAREFYENYLSEHKLKG